MGGVEGGQRGGKGGVGGERGGSVDLKEAVEAELGEQLAESGRGVVEAHAESLGGELFGKATLR